MKTKLSLFRISGAIVAVALYFLILNLEIGGTSAEIRHLLAILSSAIVLWITRPIPIYMTGILIPVVAWITDFVPFNTAFSGFAGTTFWFLFAALGIAGCIRESGVARRIALLMLTKVKPSFSSLILTLVVIMFVLGYVLPLAAARVALMLAIIVPIITLFDIQIRRNLGKATIIIVALLGAASAWQVLTGGMPGMLLWGSLDQAGYTVSWLNWALIMLMPTAIVFVIMYFVITRMFKPKGDEVPVDTQHLKKDLAALGPVQGNERKSLILLAIIVLLWVTEPIHHLGVELVGILGVFLFIVPGIGTIDFDNFMKKAIPWSLLLFVGALMSLNTMASSSGLGSYIDENLISPLYSFAGNPLTFIIATWLLNTVVSAAVLFAPSIPLLTPAIASSAITVGVNPVLGGLVYLSCFPQMFFYAAVPFFPLAYDSGAIEIKDWVKAGLFFWLAWPLAHIICFYTWYPLLEHFGVLS